MNGLQDAAFCAEQVRSHDFARYAATLFVPPAARRALLAISAFNVQICRVQEQVSQPLPGEIRLQWWTDMLEGLGHGDIARHPVAAELQAAIAAHDLPTAPLLRLIEAHLFDLYNDPMPDMATLEAYAADTSSVLFAQAARIMDSHSGDVDHIAHHAGFVQGIVHAVQQLPVDAAQRRAFVPVQMLERHGSNLDGLFAGVETPALRLVRDEMLTDARAHLDQAMQLLHETPRAACQAFLPLALLARDIRYLERSDVFARPEPPARLRILWTLWRAARSRAFGG